MALTQSDLDSLDLAIASSELKVRLEGREVTYRSTDELLKARAHVAALLAPVAVRTGPFQFNFTTLRGD